MTTHISRKQLGEKIQSLRQLKRLSRKEMAADLGLSHRSYSAIENGEVSVSLDRLQEITKLLDVDLINVLGYSSEKIISQIVHQHEGNNGENVNHKQVINDITLVSEILKAKDETIATLKNQLLYLQSAEKR